MKKIIIVDYQLGNLFSVNQACKRIGLNASISSDPKEIKNADGLILPGVGAFKQAMSNLKQFDLVKPLNDFVESGKPLFGICLGLQLLFSKSDEFGETKGLGFIKGSIKKFNLAEISSQENKYKIPNIGWNIITQDDDQIWNKTPLNDLENNSFMYFVHSYYIDPKDKNIITSFSKYGDFIYPSSIYSKNIFATQFHPEKSGEIGLKIYNKWALINNLK